MPGQVTVTIAICTWNRCQLLKQSLDSLTRLQVPVDVPWSVLVVNNNCTDETDRVVDSFTGLLPIRSVVEPTPGAANARNRVLQEVKSDYALCTDDDVQVESDWLSEFVAAARRHPTAVVIGGPITPWFPTSPDPDFVEVFPFLRDGFCGLDFNRAEGPLPNDPRMVPNAANFAIRVDRTHGVRFNPALGPSPSVIGGGFEETTFISELRKAGETVLWCPTMRVRHYVEPQRMSQSYLEGHWEQKGFEHGVLYGQRFPKMWFGVPRWLWRQFMTAAAVRVWSELEHGVRTNSPVYQKNGDGSVNPVRVRRLERRRDHKYLRGLVRGYRTRFDRVSAKHTASNAQPLPVEIRHN
jgi:glycosyltransferase involved in cell wall biosynthesis